MASLISAFKMIFKNRSMLFLTTYNEIKAKYAGSLFGLLWIILYPLLLLGAYASVYIYVFNVRFQIFDSKEYVLLIFCGLIPFLGFTEALSNGVGSVTTNSNLMKNTLFPIELAPVKSTFVSQTTQFAGMIILLVTLGIFGRWSIYTPLLVLIWILQIMLSIGIAWILSSINVFVRDLQNIIPIFVLLLMMVSPIAYPVDMVPSNLRIFLSLNPLYYLITCYQQVLMFGRFPDVKAFLILFVLALFTFGIGYSFFKKMKRVFVDNV